MIKVVQDYIFSSETENGALDKTVLGDTFSVRFDEGSILVPVEAQNIEVSVPEAQIWYSTPNVNPTPGVSQNNRMTIFCRRPDLSNIRLYTIELPKCTISDQDEVTAADLLTRYVHGELDRIQAEDFPLEQTWNNDYPLFFTEDAGTLRFILNVPNDASGSFVTVEFGVVGSIGPLIGFDGGYGIVLDPSSPPIISIIAPYPAKLANINSYLIHCDLVQTGILVNGIASQTITRVPLDVEKFGNLIIHEPNTPSIAPAPFMAGQRKEYVRCWLTDEKNRAVDTDGQDWNFRLRIEYYIPQISNVSKTY